MPSVRRLQQPAIRRKPCSHHLRPAACAPRRLCAPLVLAGLISSLLGATPAHAQGSYTGPNLTGGQGTSQGSSPSPYQTLNLQSGPLYGTNVHGTNPSCGGQIEAQWIWNASSPPGPVPQQVIVKQYSSASWESTTASGQCDDALKDAPVTTSANGDTNSTSSGTHYSVKTADANGNLEVYCTPTASVAKGSSGVYYMASASPVLIKLSGPTPDSSGNLHILIGQGCTASLSGIPSGTGWKTTYAWSISGTTFQSWSPTTPAFPNASPPTAANSQASYFVGGSGPLTNSTAHWYWDDGAALRTVSCTATVTPPAGQGAPFSVTATKNIALQIPTYQAAGIGGYMQVNMAKPDDTAHFNLWAGPTATGKANGLPAGMVWQATVTTPTVPNFGLGSLELVQLVKPNNSYTTVANPSTTVSDPQNSILCLDGTCPYGVAVPEAPIKPLNDDDAPGLLLNGGTLLSFAHKGGAYTDYLMYLPPTPASTDSNYLACQWVALGQFSWSTDGSATIPSTKNWADYSKQHGGSDAVGTVNPSAATPFSDVVGPLVFPSWGNVDSAGGSF